jgi:hypothetical protein
VEVTATTVDELVPGGWSRVRLVKIDVEGGESDVLAGMRRLIKRGVVDAVDVEVVPGNSMDSGLGNALRALVADHGARPHLVGDDGSLMQVPLDRVTNGDSHPHVVFRLD